MNDFHPTEGALGVLDEPDICSELDFLDPLLDEPDPPPRHGHPSVHDVISDELEAYARQRRLAVAQEYRLIAEILRQADLEPEFWTGPDPTLDPQWVDPRRRTASAIRRDRRDIAVRAAAADIAVRLRLSETTIRTRGANADALRKRTPQLWSQFLAGSVAEQNAVTVAVLAASLPDDATDAWAAFDEKVTAVAGILTPAKFRVAARAARERAHPESLEARHTRAAEDRGVWRVPELDGMATLTVSTSGTQAHAAFSRVDAIARHLAAQEGEERTLAQLRADVVCDLLIGGQTDAAPPTIRATVAVTIPVMTLLGLSDESATLDGYGPIDLDTAKQLAASVPSLIRVLTHPVTGTVLDVDRRTYRVPADLQRWLRVIQPTCVFPGCSRPARECDLDHRIDWQYGGPTSGDNLDPACQHHHTIKHESLWSTYRCPATGVTWWVSPTGLRSAADPAPF